MALLLTLLPLSAARAQVFSNNTAINIPEFGTATPYPGTITVSGAPVAPAGLRVRLQNFSHTFPGDISVLLVAPSGQGVELLSQNGASNPVSGLFITISSSSATPLPGVLTSGVFTPAGGNTVFSPPANAIPRAASMAALTTGNLNGQWRLFVIDLASGDAGTIAGGWELEFESAPVPTTPATPFALTYQGRLDGGVINGTIDARFAVFSSATGNSAANNVSQPVTLSGLTVTDGLFTAIVDFGRPLPTDIKTWLQVEIASPAGSAFVALTPRQPITATPLAGAASALGQSTALPTGDVVISGPQGDTLTGSLTLRATGTVASNGAGSRGGTLRLVAGNGNASAGVAPPVGTSLDNNVHIIAGDNTFGASFGTVFNGNIQFFAGNGQPERVRIVGDNGFVGIGTTNPGQALDVRGSIALGNTGELRAASGEENLRMLRGRIGPGGAIDFGSGFTVSRTSTGTYTVIFTTPFPAGSSPSFTANAFSLTARIVHINILANTAVVYQVRDTSGVLTDSDVSFIVLGPR